MQKDYWNISKRNFRAMGIVVVLFSLFLVLGVLDFSNPEAVRMKLLGILGLLVIIFILFFFIASLFKKRSPNAIKVAYVYLSLATVYSIIDSFVLSSPMKGLVFKILALCVLAYLFFNVYKASKQITTFS